MLIRHREGRKENPCHVFTDILDQLHPTEKQEPEATGRCPWVRGLAYCSLVQQTQVLAQEAWRPSVWT